MEAKNLIGKVDKIVIEQNTAMVRVIIDGKQKEQGNQVVTVAGSVVQFQFSNPEDLLPFAINKEYTITIQPV